MAIYILVFFGGFAGGAALWGILATQTSSTVALSAAGTGALIGLFATSRFKLVTDTNIDHTPSMHWAEPTIVVEPEPEHGPVMVTVEYRVRIQDVKEFSKAIHELSRVRKRDGAIQWGIFQDVADPERLVEHFIVESWAEHMRQHERVTGSDQILEKRVHAFHTGGTAPRVNHFIYAEEV